MKSGMRCTQSENISWAVLTVYDTMQEFYDAPLWRYSLFSKPLSYWKGNALAVEVDHENKTIKPVGGISWGFNLSSFQIRPICITPSALNEDD